MDQDRHSLRNPVRVWRTKWSNVCGFQALIGRPCIVGQEADFKNQDRLADRLPTSSPDTEVGCCCGGSKNPSTVLHSPKPSNARHSPPSLGLGIATDFEMSILASFNSHPASDVRQWFRKSTRHAHLQRIVVKEVYLSGYDKPHALYLYSNL